MNKQQMYSYTVAVTTHIYTVNNAKYRRAFLEFHVIHIVY